MFIKTNKKVLQSSKLVFAMPLTQGQILKKYGFSSTLWAVHGIVVKRTVAIFYLN